jgi:hypothetical protein
MIGLRHAVAATQQEEVTGIYTSELVIFTNACFLYLEQKPAENQTSNRPASSLVREPNSRSGRDEFESRVLANSAR